MQKTVFLHFSNKKKKKLKNFLLYHLSSFFSLIMYFFPTVTVPTFQIPPERPTSAMLLDEIDVEDVLTSLLGLPANNSRPGMNL